VAVSFCWGAIGFREPLKNAGIAIFGVLFLITGVFGMAVTPMLGKSKRKDEEEEGLIQSVSQILFFFF